MSSKLTKPQLLQSFVDTLLQGWTKSEVLEAVEKHGSAVQSEKPPVGASSGLKERVEEPRAKTMIEDLQLQEIRKIPLVKIASAFDDGKVLPQQSDIKRFLKQRNINAKGIKSRNQAFRRMIPALLKMSEKGLQKLLTEANFTGPAELSEISQAIRSTGADRRE